MENDTPGPHVDVTLRNGNVFWGHLANFSLGGVTLKQPLHFHTSGTQYITMILPAKLVRIIEFKDTGDLGL